MVKSLLHPDPDLGRGDGRYGNSTICDQLIKCFDKFKHKFFCINFFWKESVESITPGLMKKAALVLNFSSKGAIIV